MPTIDISRSFLYYVPSARKKEKKLKAQLVKAFEKVPIYGEAKAHQQLLEAGYQSA